jgi:hypothetical protein
MLPYKQPKQLGVTMYADDLRTSQWKKLVELYSGEVLLSLYPNDGVGTPHDDLLKPLNDSK